MKCEEVLACSFAAWYPLFEKTTFTSRIIPLPAPVLEYLLEDGQLVLPVECNGENYDGKEEDYDDFGDVDWSDQDGDERTAFNNNLVQNCQNNSELSDTTRTDSSESSTVVSSEAANQKSFPEFCSRLQSVLDSFGGKMFCKLNWSSPKDATWIGFNNSLKVTSLTQLFLLLKSSDFIVHDLTSPFKLCEDPPDNPTKDVEYSLILRKWMDVNPGQEYRCFVRQKSLFAITQRDNTNYYDHIRAEEESIKQDIISFFREQVHDKFPLENYVFDVVRLRKDRVKLVDFNPYGEVTDPLLFTWDQLEKNDMTELDFRYITDSSGVQPHPFRQYSIPQDFVDLSTGTDPNKLIDFLKLKTRTEAGESSSDDSEDDTS